MSGDSQETVIHCQNHMRSSGLDTAAVGAAIATFNRCSIVDGSLEKVSKYARYHFKAQDLLRPINKAESKLLEKCLRQKCILLPLVLDKDMDVFLTKTWISVISVEPW